MDTLSQMAGFGACLTGLGAYRDNLAMVIIGTLGCIAALVLKAAQAKS